MKTNLIIFLLSLAALVLNSAVLGAENLPTTCLVYTCTFASLINLVYKLEKKN